MRRVLLAAATALVAFGVAWAPEHNPRLGTTHKTIPREDGKPDYAPPIPLIDLTRWEIPEYTPPVDVIPVPEIIRVDIPSITTFPLLEFPTDHPRGFWLLFVDYFNYTPYVYGYQPPVSPPTGPPVVITPTGVIPTPEPGVWMMMVGGFLAVGWRIRLGNKA